MTPVAVDALRLEVHRSGYELRTFDASLLGETGEVGYTDADRRAVWVAEGLSPRELRSTLAHEIVHARMQHGFTGTAVNPWRGKDEPWLETAVDALAASMLFTAAEFDAARARRNNPTYGELARSLGVDMAMVRAWWELRKIAMAEKR